MKTDTLSHKHSVVQYPMLKNLYPVQAAFKVRIRGKKWFIPVVKSVSIFRLIDYTLSSKDVKCKVSVTALKQHFVRSYILKDVI